MKNIYKARYTKIVIQIEQKTNNDFKNKTFTMHTAQKHMYEIQAIQTSRFSKHTRVTPTNNLTDSIPTLVRKKKIAHSIFQHFRMQKEVNEN